MPSHNARTSSPNHCDFIAFRPTTSLLIEKCWMSNRSRSERMKITFVARQYQQQRRKKSCRFNCTEYDSSECYARSTTIVDALSVSHSSLCDNVSSSFNLLYSKWGRKNWLPCLADWLWNGRRQRNACNMNSTIYERSEKKLFTFRIRVELRQWGQHGKRMDVAAIAHMSTFPMPQQYMKYWIWYSLGCLL